MLADEVKETIVAVIEQTEPDVFIVDMSLNRGKANTLHIRVDTDNGISLAQCTQISRADGRELEEMPEMDFPYRLEVSSPGVGFPLKLHRQYVQNKGRHLMLLLQKDDS